MRLDTALLGVGVTCCLSLMAMAAHSDPVATDGRPDIPVLSQSEKSESRRAVASASAVSATTANALDLATPDPTGASTNTFDESNKEAISILAGATLVQQGVWHLGPRKVGVASDYEFSKPIDVSDLKWKLSRYSEKTDSYRFVTVKFGVKGLKRITVLFDLEKSKIVAVEPVEYQSVVGFNTDGIDAEFESEGGESR
jgi:hypothetical protein